MRSKSVKPRSAGPPSSRAGSTQGNTIPVPPPDEVVEPVTQEMPAIPSLYQEEIDGTNTDQTAVLAPTSVRSAQRATLMVLAGLAAGKVYPIESDHFVIGRGKEVTLTLADPGVSRIHCSIVRDATGRYFIEDKGSTNGTLVNAVRVQRTELRSGDRFQIGAEAVLQFGFFDAAEEDLVNKLYESATRDPLTRALNRRAFQERLLAEVSYASRHREPLVAILLDIDRFKSVNDTYGHAAGDIVLRGVATSIATTLRTEDVFARYGGEEFALLGRGLSITDGIKLAGRIRVVVKDAVFRLSEQRLQVTVSAGVAEIAETNDATGEALLALADRRLYAAKNSGRDRVVGK